MGKVEVKNTISNEPLAAYTKPAARLKSALKSWEAFLLLLIVLEFVIFGTANPRFLMSRVIFGSLNDVMAICICSLFVTFVLITGGIDIQAASIMGLVSITIGVGWQDFGLNIWVAAAIGVLFAVACGALSGFFVAYCGVQPMVITLGGSFLYAGIALLISNLSTSAAYQGISGFPEYFTFVGKYKIAGVVPIQLIIFLLLAVVAYFILHRSKYGRKIFLVGTNQQAADFCGINSKAVIMSTYMLSGLAAGIAGIITTAYVGSAKCDLGSTGTMSIITAVVLGGTLSTGGKGSIIGTALAALVVGIMRFGLPLAFKVNSQYLDVPVGILLIVVVVGRAILSTPKAQAFIGKLKKGDSGEAAKAA